MRLCSIWHKPLSGAAVYIGACTVSLPLCSVESPWCTLQLCESSARKGWFLSLLQLSRYGELFNRLAIFCFIPSTLGIVLWVSQQLLVLSSPRALHPRTPFLLVPGYCTRVGRVYFSRYVRNSGVSTSENFASSVIFASSLRWITESAYSRRQLDYRVAPKSKPIYLGSCACPKRGRPWRTGLRVTQLMSRGRSLSNHRPP